MNRRRRVHGAAAAMADPDDSPILDGVLDPEAGDPLVRRGGVGHE